MKVIKIYEDGGKAVPVTGAPPFETRYQDDDEISLVDLLIILNRRKWLIAAVFTAVLMLGLVAALLKPQAFTYTTSLQIAKGVSGLIESPATVVAKLNESYIPFVLREAYDQAPGTKSFKITAKVPKDSQIVIMESYGGIDDQTRQAKLHKEIVDRLVLDHNRDLNAVRLDLQAEQSRVRTQIASLSGASTLLKERAKRFDEQEALLRQQLADVQRRIDENEGVRRNLLQEKPGESRTSNLMFIESELVRLRERESSLSEQVLVAINMQRDELKSQTIDNTRQLADLQENLQGIDAKLAAINPTRPITPTLRSLDAAGAGITTIIAIALVVGLMLGLFAAFFAEFIARAREKIQAEQP